MDGLINIKPMKNYFVKIIFKSEFNKFSIYSYTNYANKKKE